MSINFKLKKNAFTISREMTVLKHFNYLHVVNFTHIFITVLYSQYFIKYTNIWKLLLFIFVLYLLISFPIMFPSEYSFPLTLEQFYSWWIFLHFVCLKMFLFRFHFILRVIFFKPREYNSIVFWFSFLSFEKPAIILSMIL